MMENFDPYPETIFVHDNAFSGGGDNPDHEGLEAVRLALYGAEGRLPDIVWDGVSHPERTGAEHAICVNNPACAIAQHRRRQRLRQPCR